MCTGWEQAADEHNGLMLFGALVGAALLAAILGELVIPSWVHRRNKRRAKSLSPEALN